MVSPTSMRFVRDLGGFHPLPWKKFYSSSVPLFFSLFFSSFRFPEKLQKSLAKEESLRNQIARYRKKEKKKKRNFSEIYICVVTRRLPTKTAAGYDDETT